MKAGDVGDGEAGAIALLLLAPSRAAAAAGPAEEKLDTDTRSSSTFFLLPNSEPRNESLLFVLSFLSFFPNRPDDFFSFSFSRPALLATDLADAPEVVRVSCGRSMGESLPADGEEGDMAMGESIMLVR